MKESERAMRAALEEIRSLRRRNEILEAKVEVMNLFAVTLHSSPAYPSQGMGEDAAWLLQKEIDRLEEEKAAEPKIMPAPKER